jgi:SAM-dependent methyltransferase
MKPYSESCDQNREPILEVLKEVFADRRHVLEIGSGTGQHAVFFSEKLPQLIWQTSDLPANHAGIRAWLDELGSERVLPPIAIDTTEPDWSIDAAVDAVFSANTAHIMHWPAVQGMFAGIGRYLAPGGVFALYGPFNYEGRYTSESNARFDQWLKGRDPLSGIRDFEALCELAGEAGMALEKDYQMPANNRILVWRKG